MGRSLQCEHLYLPVCVEQFHTSIVVICRFESVRRMGEAAGLRYASSSASLDLCNAAVYAEVGMLRDTKTAEAFFTGVGCEDFNDASLASKSTNKVAKARTSSNGPVARARKTTSLTSKYAMEENSPSLIHTDAEYVIDQGSVPRGAHGECHMLGPEATAGRVGGDLGQTYAKLQPYKRLLDKLSGLLGCCSPTLCTRDKSLGGAGLAPTPFQSSGENTHATNATAEGVMCGLADLGSFWDAHHWYTTFEGPLYAGKWFGEWFLLTYLNGMPFAWGELSEEEVVELGSFVTLYRSFEFDAGAAAGAFGSTLAAHLAVSLDQWTSSESKTDNTRSDEASGQIPFRQDPSLPVSTPVVGHGPEVDVVYYAAHGELLRDPMGLNFP